MVLVYNADQGGIWGVTWRIWKKLLVRCEEKSMVLKWEKCHFMVIKGIILGYIVSAKAIEVYKAKVELISNLPIPKIVKDMHSFLGHVRFYRRFIKGFSAITRHLCNLLTKDAQFDWSTNCGLLLLKNKKYVDFGSNHATTKLGPPI